MLTRVVLAVSLVSALACAGVFPEPTEGTYDVAFSNLEETGCEESEINLFRGSEAIEVDLNEAAEEMTLGDVPCQLAGAAFDCSDEEKHSTSGDFDITLVTTTVITGRWTTSDTFTSDWEYAYFCEGLDCGEAIDRCDMSFTIEGTLD